jgi:hypothetical protein
MIKLILRKKRKKKILNFFKYHKCDSKLLFKKHNFVDLFLATK